MPRCVNATSVSRSRGTQWGTSPHRQAVSTMKSQGCGRLVIPTLASRTPSPVDAPNPWRPITHGFCVKTETKIRTAKPVEKLYKLFDERGLFLLITPPASAPATSSCWPWAGEPLQGSRAGREDPVRHAAEVDGSTRRPADRD